ncbi:MAG: thiamine diphosphokinase [Bacillota bacterium]|nr:thiamine diphosphokinase [Bacillota bacterium]
MRKGIAYIVGAGDFDKRGFAPMQDDLVIAADGGYDSLARHHLRVDLLLGDLDSIAQVPSGIARLRFPPKKDLTDMAIGIQMAKGRGYRRFLLYGALGKRLDHTLANLQLLSGLAKDEYQAKIMSGNLIVHALSDSCLFLPPVKKGSLISVFCWGDRAEGVTLKGLKYPLENAVLTAHEPLGISNEGRGTPAKISVRQGVLLVFQYLQV